MDIVELYPYSYRFSDMFPDREEVRGLQVDLDRLIQEGVDRITELSEMAPSGNEEYSDREAYNPEPSGMRYIPPSYERRDSRQHSKAPTEWKLFIILLQPIECMLDFFLLCIPVIRGCIYRSTANS